MYIPLSEIKEESKVYRRVGITENYSMVDKVGQTDNIYKLN